MKPVIRISLTIVILLLLVVSFYFISRTVSQITGKGILGWVINPEPENKDNALDNFAKCLTERGAELYINEGCSYCQKQKNMFGSSLQYLNIIRCEEYGAACTEKGIEGVPTWIINREKYTGVQSLEKLSEISGCLF